jgi:uncharacterized membrane protein YedE/YeeE
MELSRGKGIVQREFLYLLLALAFVGASLFAVFTLLASTEVGEPVALLLFLMVVGLMVTGYMGGVLVLAVAAISVLTRYAGRLGRQEPKPSA